jgi:hypothetical protein
MPNVLRRLTSFRRRDRLGAELAEEMRLHPMVTLRSE